jgi:transcriptional regulator GlxA family with amidase domain
MLLEGAGLLKGRTATTNSHAQEELRATGVTVLPHRVVDDGNVITAGSLSAGLDLALWIIEREAGREFALAVADVVEYLPRDDVWARPLPSPTS